MKWGSKGVPDKKIDGINSESQLMDDGSEWGDSERYHELEGRACRDRTAQRRRMASWTRPVRAACIVLATASCDGLPLHLMDAQYIQRSTYITSAYMHLPHASWLP